jgi:hypothetical protein
MGNRDRADERHRRQNACYFFHLNTAFFSWMFSRTNRAVMERTSGIASRQPFMSWSVPVGPVTRWWAEKRELRRRIVDLVEEIVAEAQA